MSEVRRRIEFFPLSEAVDNAVSGMRGDITCSPSTQEALIDLAKLGAQNGLSAECLVREQKADGSIGFSLILAHGRPGYIFPRHSHDGDCLYYVQSGQIIMGTMTFNSGDSFLVPKDVVYGFEIGPEGCDFLEIRYGVSQYASDMPDQSPKYWDSLREAFAAKAPSWR